MIIIDSTKIEYGRRISSCQNNEQLSSVMKEARCQAYTKIGQLLYGHSYDDKKRQRVVCFLPSCTKNKVRREFPDPAGRYTGYEKDKQIVHCLDTVAADN